MERRLAFGIIGCVADKRSDLDLLIIRTALLNAPIAVNVAA